MNSYFDQQWDQQLAGRPQALAAFTSLSPAAQERIVGYVQSCDNPRGIPPHQPDAGAAGGRRIHAIRGGIIPTKKPPRRAFSLSPAAFYLFTGAPPACSHR